MIVYGSVGAYRFSPTFAERVRSDYSVNQGRVWPGSAQGRKSTRYGKSIVSDSSTILDFYSAYKLNFEKLLSSARDLTKANQTSAFEKRAVEIDKPHVMEGEANYGALVKVYDVNVEQLATARMDRSDFVNKNALVTDHFKDEEGNNLLEAREYKFRITQGGVSEEFSIKLEEEILSGDPDRATFDGVFQQLADAINSSSLDLEASFGRDMGRSSEVRFTIAATDKGTAADFKIEDIKEKVKDEDTGKHMIVPQPGFIETLGLNTVDAAKDSVVNIDGIKNYNHYSSGDQVILFDGHDVEINLTSQGQSYFMVTKDIKEVKDAIEHFTNEYSNTLSFLRNTGTNGETDNLIERLVQIAKDESDNLKAIGIGVSEGGRLLIEKGLFEGVLEEKLDKDFGMVEEILGGLRGIATKVALLADNSLQLSPLRFLNELPELNFFDVVKDAYDMMGRMMFQGFGHQGMIIDMSL